MFPSFFYGKTDIPRIAFYQIRKSLAQRTQEHLAIMKLRRRKIPGDLRAQSSIRAPGNMREDACHRFHGIYACGR